MTALQGVSEASMAVKGMFHAPATLHAVSADYTEDTERCPTAQSLHFSQTQNTTSIIDIYFI